MKLSIAVSNRDRLDPTTNISKFFLKSLEKQTFQDFELVVADGGSKNIEQLKALEETLPFTFRVVSFIIGEKFERARLNNVGVRNSNNEYVLTTDVDMLFAPTFFENVMEIFKKHPKAFIESRTMYLKNPWVKKYVYSGKIDPFKRPEDLRRFRLKKRTTAGGCQCMNIDQWNNLRGFDEKYVGWGSEDYDLLTRVNKKGLQVVWLGESPETVEVFHQPHFKSAEQVKIDLSCQNKNKRLLKKIGNNEVNVDGWGGKNENI